MRHCHLNFANDRYDLAERALLLINPTLQARANGLRQKQKSDYPYQQSETDG